jgi:hypothetical protein
MQRLSSWVGVAGVSALLLAGCGGSSSNSNFKSNYQSAVSHLKTDSESIGGVIQQAKSMSDAEILSKFKSLAASWQSHLSQLETLKPPSNVAADFNTLTNAATRVESDLNAVVSAAATHSQSAAEQAGASLVTDITAAKGASTSIDSKLGIK